MSWNYEDKLTEYIAQANRDAGLLDENGNPYVFEVCTEQIYAERNMKPGVIYVVIKYLSTTNSLNVVVQPIQILVLSEQNQLQASQIIFGKLVASHNFETLTDNSTYVKQDYREPVVLSNFNAVSYGYRSVMYISATLYIMENVMDIEDLRIGSEEVKPINFNIAYSMTPNTQPIPPSKLATSVKSLATFSITFSVPLTSEYAFLTTISEIMAGVTSGNTNFEIAFSIGSVKFGYFEDGDEPLNLKLTSCQITTAINEVPSIQIGLMK